jgi:hypothetical protein
MKTLIKIINKEKLLVIKNNHVPIKSLKTIDIFLTKTKIEVSSFNEDYLLISGLNKNSVFGVLFNLYAKILNPLQTKIRLSNPQNLHVLFKSSHHLIYAKYFSFIPCNIRNTVISKQIDYIGQRWLARFANCFVLIYKKK